MCDRKIYMFNWKKRKRTWNKNAIQATKATKNIICVIIKIKRRKNDILIKLYIYNLSPLVHNFLIANYIRVFVSFLLLVKSWSYFANEI
jgi:hypothetical protein